MRKIDSIFIHCSDSNVADHDDIAVIKQWHLDRGFKDVGYHLFIRRQGSVQLGRPLQIPGAHAKGYNDYSIGICLSGSGDFTEHQIDSLIAIVITLLKAFNLTIRDVYGHSEVNFNKTCPNLNMREFRQKLGERYER